ncbi:RNA-binding RNA annealing protein, partial [Coemansia nantahalensis]
KRDGRKTQQQQQQMMMVNQSALLAAAAAQQKGRGSGKILIGNLDYNVTEADLRALFGQVGPVTKTSINYGPNGKSKGAGEVTFRNAAHANAAYDKYHNLELDGRKMKIEIVGGAAPAMPVFMPTIVPQQTTQRPARGANQSRNTAASSAAQEGKAGARGRRGGRGGRSGDADKKRNVTAEELDAELDTYMEGVEKSGA